jgi:hypothetical protein
MKLNFRQGFFRVCVILSLFFGMPFTWVWITSPNSSTFWMAVCMVVWPWMFYWIGVYIADGFTQSRGR